jgi:H+/Cl- antiporter ClcA
VTGEYSVAVANDVKAKPRNPTGDARELVDLVIAYAKQETVQPLKGLLKKAALGLGGALLLGIGGIFCSLAALRAMQSETDFFERHNLSYLPYFVTVVILVVLSLIGWVGLGPGKRDK